MIAVQHSVRIKRSPRAVFASLANLSDWQHWSSNWAGSGPVSAKSIEIGLRIHRLAENGLKPVMSRLVVRDWIPNWTLGAKPPSLHGEMKLIPHATGTWLTAHFELDAEGLNALVYRLLLSQWVKQDLHRFKEWIESSDS